jgi:hypothetical protein
MIGCFDQRILASLCYAGMTARLPHDDIGQDAIAMACFGLSWASRRATGLQ